ncbi:MAG: hypothetical protein R2744_07610 [Bacteroidales bacterium]
MDTTTLAKFQPDYRYYDILASAGGLITFFDGFVQALGDGKILMTNSLRLDLNGNFIIADALWLGGHGALEKRL